MEGDWADEHSAVSKCNLCLLFWCNNYSLFSRFGKASKKKKFFLRENISPNLQPILNAPSLFFGFLSLPSITNTNYFSP